VAVGVVLWALITLTLTKKMTFCWHQ